MRCLVWTNLVAVLWCLGHAASAADWPQHHGPNRDSHSPETGLKTAWPETGLVPLWTAEGLGAGFSSAAIARGRVYVTGMVEETGIGSLFCFDLEGKLLWKEEYGPEWTGTYPGPRSTTTLVKDRGYFMSGMGMVNCFEAETGHLVWKRDIHKDFPGIMPVMGFAESLLVVDGKVICTPGGEDASVVALDAATGETVWTSTGLSEQNAYCSPLHIERGGTHLMVTLLGKSLVGLDPETGALRWRHPFDVDAEDPNHSVAPVYAEGCLYITSGHREGGQMLALAEDGNSVRLLWEDAVLNTLHGGLLALDGYLYGANSKARWLCLAMADGSPQYEDRGVGAGSLIYAEGMLYCYGEKGKLALVKATPKGYETVSLFKVEQGSAQHWAHPSLSEGHLYIRHGDALVVYDCRAE